MRLMTFEHGGSIRAGLLVNDTHLIDLGHPLATAKLGGTRPELAAFVALSPAGMTDVLSDVGEECVEALLPLEDVRVLAPLPRPRRIYGVAFNYRDAVAERGLPLPHRPRIFLKNSDTVIAHGEPILLPAGAGGITYEAELAAIIGSPAENVTEREALAKVAGYAVFNDVSASEIIKRDGNFDRGKNFPTFGPFGPWLVTADEVPDPQTLGIGFRQDDVVLQHSSTAQMLFGVAELISILSSEHRLLPGDVIATGTPAGVAAMRDPPSWLRAGATATAWVEGLGTLSNPVRSETAS
jgi:2-keto-4-pentenoate hydratase/2-oxohepta-3-ene-1,7-dioic acid hydratase in catechol pathway